MSPFRSILGVLAILASGESAFTQEPTAQLKGFLAGEIEFLQSNFTNFARVSFLPPIDKAETVIQSFKVIENVVGTHEGIAYVGVRFTLPDWLDGDLHWNYFHLNPESQKRQRVGLMSGIVPERGKRIAYIARRIDPDDTQGFWKRYPFTRRVYSFKAARTNLQAGQSYGVYLAHFQPTVPDVAFALTIDSERGRKEFGSLSYISGPIGIPGSSSVSPLAAFIQQHWANFPIVSFLPPTNKTETAFQRFRVIGNIVGEFDGLTYSGVRFTAPEWMDGDFKFAFVHLYRSVEELQRRPGYSWGITGEHGDVPETKNTAERLFFKDFPATQARFPNTEKGYTGAVRRTKFVPGKTYVFWWGHWWGQVEGVAPDLALAFTIASDRGREEFGEITWR